MFNSLWLDLGWSASGEPLLLEHHRSYRHIAAESQEYLELILLVRGSRHSEYNYLSYAGDQVHLRRIGPPLVFVVECGLHLLPAITKSDVSDRRVPGLISRHKVPGVHIPEIARLLYSRILSLFSTVLIFIEEEFGGLAGVIHELAAWAHSSPSTSSRHRPRVLIVTAQRKHDSRRLEWELTAEILANFNPSRELSFKMAEKVWRKCFEGIEHVGRPQAVDGIYRLVLGVPFKVPYPRLGACQFAGLLRAGFRRFARCQQEPLGLIDVVRATRDDPVPLELPLVRALRKRAGNAQELGVLSKLIASALTVDGYRRGLADAGLPPEEVFEEFYSAPLWRLATQASLVAIFDRVKRYFAELTVAAAAGTIDPVAHHRGILRGVGSLNRDCAGMCLSCLVCEASSWLSCSHGLCDRCAGLHCQEAEGQSLLLPACVFCGAANDAKLHVKPSTAGVRILRLAGPVGKAREIADFLRSLRSALRNPLHHHFDIVIAGGIGMFFAVMLFCKRATVEDCIHHLPNLECAKASRWGLKFGRHLRFRHDELNTNGIRLLLQHKRSLRRECEEERVCFWPQARRDIVVEFDGDTPKQGPVGHIADRLLVSLFYIEVEDFLCSQTYLPVSIRCRLSSGHGLVDLLMRARQRNAQIHFSGQTSVLCPEDSWRDATRGKPFLRRIYLTISSPSDMVDIKISGLGSDTTSLSNCPYRLEALTDESPRNPKAGSVNYRSCITSTVDRLNVELYQFLKPL